MNEDKLGEQVTDVLAWFKNNNDKYQTAINKALRDYISSH